METRGMAMRANVLVVLRCALDSVTGGVPSSTSCGVILCVTSLFLPTPRTRSSQFPTAFHIENSSPVFIFPKIFFSAPVGIASQVL